MDATLHSEVSVMPPGPSGVGFANLGGVTQASKLLRAADSSRSKTDAFERQSLVERQNRCQFPTICPDTLRGGGNAIPLTKLRMAATAYGGTARKLVTRKCGRTMTKSEERGGSRRDGTDFGWVRETMEQSGSLIPDYVSWNDSERGLIRSREILIDPTIFQTNPENRTVPGFLAGRGARDHSAGRVSTGKNAENQSEIKTSGEDCWVAARPVRIDAFPWAALPMGIALRDLSRIGSRGQGENGPSHGSQKAEVEGSPVRK